MTSTKAGLIAADRAIGKWEASLSIAASWIWAPSLFVSAQKSYQDGILGLFWFVVPNVLCLFLFSLFAERVRQQLPNGFTISSYIREKTSSRVQAVYLTTLIGLTICAFAVQLLAGGQLFNRLTGISFPICTLLLSLIPLSYSLFSGLKATIVTDILKILFIYAIGFFLVPWAVSNAGDFSTVTAGFKGQVGSTNFFGPESLKIFLTFGLPTTIGLLAGPFGDQTFWQRAFAIKEKYVRISFIQGALLFALVPLMMSFLGFAATGSSLKVSEPQMVNLEFITQNLPPFATWVFVFMILVALVSILDSKLTAVASLGAHDFLQRFRSESAGNFQLAVLYSRVSMILLTLFAVLIANIPNIKILHLFLFYGTLRSATVLPTIMLILGKRLAERAVFYGILFSLFIGLPVFSYGNIYQIPSLIVIGSILTVSSSGLIAYFWSKKLSTESTSTTV